MKRNEADATTATQQIEDLEQQMDKQKQLRAKLEEDSRVILIHINAATEEKRRLDLLLEESKAEYKSVKDEIVKINKQE